MKIKLEILLSCIVLMVISSPLIAGTIKGEVEKAREIKDRKVIKCTPDGKNGGLLPIKAVSLLEDGMTLLLMPGTYSETIEIFKNKIILKSEGNGACYATVKLSGRDCIVKNINLSKLYSTRDIVVIDSLISYFSCGYWNSKNNEKVDVYIYNTGLGALSSISTKNTIVEMKNCVINGSITCNSNLRITIENSILNSSATLFCFYNYENKKGRIALKNNQLFTKSKLGKFVYSVSASKRDAVIFTMKDLKRFWGVVLSGENIIEEPKFLPGNSYFVELSDTTKGKGLIVEEHPFKPESKEKDVVIVKDSEPEKKSEVAVSDTKKEDAKEVKKNHVSPKKEDDDIFGGIPKPPE